MEECHHQSWRWSGQVADSLVSDLGHWLQIPILLLPGCVTLGKGLGLSVLQCPHL